MKLKVLVDNNTYIDQYYCGEPAVSYYIEDEDTSFLFDVGYSDLFIRNSDALGIDLQNISSIVISHGHDDHTRGLKYYFEQNYKKNISIIAHSDAFNEKIIGDLKICSPILKHELKGKCNLILSKDPIKVSENITFLGEIPKVNNFEPRKPMGKQLINKTLVDDYIKDDTALVYKSKNGIYIITGCSHSGICNIIEYTKKVCKDNRVLGVIGGFHLFEVNEQVTKTIDYLKQNNVKELYPCHCTSFSVRAEIHKTLPVKEVGVGLELNW
ncbi:metallo-beta-lactamase superfamily protein [Clostridium sporogenes]|uniref:MBL fold metallo-hydrolase n=1 Tax=Clostridium TaxID=1485 RepID=UPI0005F94B64|nr:MULTISPECIES: MBL fold metallo-hydrolase [Clostridium]APF28510.1 metallo-beta-lactamase superfamily protein [Clostridium sporogenes]MDI6920046.1 MBL fold metallo-hydrolase [Clostridium botulinum]WMU98773.1 MBL fold metallo-hydrolase [Clostridium botulinum]